MAEKPEPRRLRWSVPRADESTNRWLDEQYDISRSLQLLIRESIQRDGYIDVVNRPVEQLPRRGRPPQTESEADDDRAEQGAQGRTPAREEPVAESAEAPAEAVADVEAEVPVEQPIEDATPDEAAAPPAQRAEAPEKKSAPSGLDAFLTR